MTIRKICCCILTLLLVAAPLSAFAATYSFDGNGNTSGDTPSDDNVLTGDPSNSYQMPYQGSLLRTDHDFLGWSLSQSATTAEFEGGGYYNLLFNLPQEDATFYAVWEFIGTITPPEDPEGPDDPSDSDEPYFEPVTNYAQAKIGNCREWVNVRSGPGAQNDVIGRVYLGEQVEILQWDETGAWCKVIYNNGNSCGWVHGQYIIPQK